MNDMYNKSQSCFSAIAYHVTKKKARVPAVRFETKGCHRSNIDDKQFEFVLVKDSFLESFAASADASAFAEYFRADASDAITFSNLGGDALLIVPQPLTKESEDIYGHFANFMTRASASQIAGTWRLVAQEYLKRMQAGNEKSIWLSTAGTGVAWLHFRLDDRPKYYLYKAFAYET